MERKHLALAAAAVAAAGALAWAFAPRPLEVEAAVVERGRFEQSIEEDGRTRLRDRYTVSAPVAARLARIALREGDAVEAGDAVAVLTPAMPTMIDERAVREATARLRGAEAGVAAAAAREARARVAQEEARLDLERNRQLAGQGFVAAAKLDSARLALDAARTELEAARGAQAVARYEREQAAAVLAPPAHGASAAPLTLRSPVRGVVLKVPLPSESTVPAGTALLDIGDPARLEIVAELLTPDAVQARPGTRAVVERWGGPALEARVRRVDPGAFLKVSALGIEEQRVNVVLDIVDGAPAAAWGAMGDGYRVTVRVITASADDAVLVPVGALVPAEDGSMAAYAIEAGRAVLRPVVLAGRNGTHGWVRSGLAPGQQVIVYPPPAVAAGKRVSVRSG